MFKDTTEYNDDKYCQPKFTGDEEWNRQMEFLRFLVKLKPIEKPIFVGFFHSFNHSFLTTYLTY